MGLVANHPSAMPGLSAVASPWARSLAGWRVALRMAARDIRSAKGRSALIVALIGLPVLALVVGLVLVASVGGFSSAERYKREMGGAQAIITERGDLAVTQNSYSWSTTSGDKAAPLPTPLKPDDTDPRHLASAAAALLPGFELTPTVGQVAVAGDAAGSASAGSAAVPLTRGLLLGVQAGDATRPAVTPLAQVVEGRYPHGQNEVAVTRHGVALGLPTSGPLAVRLGGRAPEVRTVVGVVEATGDTTLVADLTDQMAADASMSGVLIDGPEPVTLPIVQKLNRYGLVVQSRALIDHPPAEWDSADRNDPMSVVLAVVVTGILLEMCLLAGPAFAIGAQRQRRSLALAASNGAEVSQLRKVMLGQAVILGVVIAVAAALAGVALATWVVIPQLNQHLAGPLRGELRGPVAIPWGYVLAVSAAAAVACVVAAAIPSRGLGRLDVINVLRGQAVSPRVHAGMPILGMVVLVIGGALTVAAIVGQWASDVGTVAISIGAIMLVIGVIMLVPAILAVVGHATKRLPIAARMATRDATRQRGRAVPTAAALIGGAAILAASGTAAVSGEAVRELTYRPRLPMGWASLDLGAVSQGPWAGRIAQESTEAMTQRISKVVPGVVVHDVREVRWQAPGSATSTSPESVDTQVALLRPGCSTADLQEQVRSRATPKTACSMVESMGVYSSVGADTVPDPGGAGIGVIDPVVARAIFGLDANAAAALERGDIVVGNDSVVARVKAGSVALARITTPGERLRRASVHDLGQRMRVTVAQTSDGSLSGTSSGWAFAAIISPQRAAELGLPASRYTSYLTTPRGMITPAEENAIASVYDELGGAQLSVERGYRNESALALVLLFVTVGLLSTVAVVVATALSVRESRRDLEMLAAVGASSGLRRRFSAWQAAFLAGLGTLLGYAVGLVPGIAMCWPLTVGRLKGAPDAVTQGRQVLIQVPWLQLGLTLALVCAVSAAVAAMMAGREGPLTRRAT